MKTVVLASFLLLSTLLFSQHQVGHTTVTFNDPSRAGGFGSGGGAGRQIQSEIYYPTTTSGVDVAIASGTFPVIVFGHGFVMTWEAYENIWEEMVPKGYIMVFPRTEGGFSPNHEEFGKDLAIAVTEMQLLNNDNTSLFYNAVKPKSAIMGHSMGGGATFIAAANNASIETIIGLAPAETNPSAVDAAENVGVPTLVLSGSSDGVTAPNDHHLLIHNAVPTCKYFISITGGAHCYFANSNFNCDTGEALSSSGITVTRLEQQDITYEYISNWLAYYLLDDTSAINDFSEALDTDNRITFEESNCSSTVQLNTFDAHLVSIYPNPSQDVLHIEALFPFLCRIIDSKGNVVVNDKKESQLKTFNLSELSDGIYMIQIQTQDHTSSERILIQR